MKKRRPLVFALALAACSAAGPTTTSGVAPTEDVHVDSDAGDSDRAQAPTAVTDAGASRADAASPFVVPPFLAPHDVRDGFLRDPSGRTTILRGVNLSGKNKYAPYFDQKTQADFDRLSADWSMNSIRLVTTWAAIEPAEGVYDDAFLDALALRVEWARNAHLFVVVDMHQDVYGEGFAMGGGDGAPTWTCDAIHYASFSPAFLWTANYLSSHVQACYDHFWSTPSLKAHYREAWRRIARRLAAYDNVVGFDVMNEPFWGSYLPLAFEHDLLMPLYEDVVAAVRTEAPDWVAFIEPSSARNFVGKTALPKPTFQRFMFAPHSYDPLAESGIAFDKSRRAAIVSNVAALWQEARALGGGLWIGEYGSVSTLGGVYDYMDAQYEGMSAVAASSAYWDYSDGGYGLVTTDGGEKTSLMPTVVRPYPEAVAGTPLGWTFDAGTRSFTLRYHADASVKAPTVIAVPAREYPAGPTVACVGCKWVRVGDQLFVTEPPTGDPAVISLHP